MNTFDVMTQDEILAELRAMVDDPALITESSYRSNSELWPKNRIQFTDCHMLYLQTHPKVNPRHYLSNLKLMIRNRPKKLT